MNPDYLSQTKKLQQENIRLAYAKNQRLPQLDLKASYGLNGLGPNTWSSWEDAEHGGFPSFSAGVELRVPLAGGIRGRNGLDVAKLRKQEALLSLHEIESQVLNSITASLWKIRSSVTSILDYEQIVAFSRERLDTEMKRLEVGKVGAQRVLDADAALLEAKNAVVEARVRTGRAGLELELAQGTVLQSRNLESSQHAVRDRTLRLLRDAGMPPEQYQEWLKGIPSAPPDRVGPPDPGVPSPAGTAEK
jgi:outer membrane protein TolC